MPQMIFVNLPVADLAVSRAFYAALGFGFDERFCNEQAICVVLSDTIYAMLLKPDFFAGFIDRPVADTRASVGALLCISRDSRAEVDATTARALAAGGRETRPAQDLGFMYSRSFTDPDGHVWEPMWMDEAAAVAAMTAGQAAVLPQ